MSSWKCVSSCPGRSAQSTCQNDSMVGVLGNPRSHRRNTPGVAFCGRRRGSSALRPGCGGAGADAACAAAGKALLRRLAAQWRRERGVAQRVLCPFQASDGITSVLLPRELLEAGPAELCRLMEKHRAIFGFLEIEEADPWLRLLIFGPDPKPGILALLELTEELLPGSLERAPVRSDALLGASVIRCSVYGGEAALARHLQTLSRCLEAESDTLPWVLKPTPVLLQVLAAPVGLVSVGLSTRGLLAMQCRPLPTPDPEHLQLQPPRLLLRPLARFLGGLSFCAGGGPEVPSDGARRCVQCCLPMTGSGWWADWEQLPKDIKSKRDFRAQSPLKPDAGLRFTPSLTRCRCGPRRPEMRARRVY